MNKLNPKSKSRARGSQRQELEVNLPLVLLVAAAITVGVYGILLLFRETYLGILFTKEDLLNM